MRFDDMLATVLNWPCDDGLARARVWRQLVDLLAQHRAAYSDPADVDRAYAAVRSLRGSVSEGERRIVASRLAACRPPAALVAVFAEEPDLARPLLSCVMLDEAEWRAILPKLVARARDILTTRHDLPVAIAEALAPTPLPVAVVAPPTQISDILARIEAFRDRAAAYPTEPRDGSFGFTIDAEGGLHTREGAPLAARLGADPQGVDGQASGAWRARAGFADARLVIADGPHAGEWRMSAEPILDAAGELIGYRGTARAPRPDESAAAPPDPVRTEAVQVERFDRAIEGLRLPLETVARFDGDEVLPGGDARAAASAVVERSLELIEAIDGFDLAIEAAGDGERIEAGTVLARLHAALQPLAETRGVALSFRITRDLPPIDADPLAVERMFARLTGAALALGRRGERLVVRLGLDRTDGRRAALVLTRPGRLVGRTHEALLDPPTTGRAPDAPLLAFGFALRLVDRLAGEAGGSLTIHEDRLVLALPLRARRLSARSPLR